MKKINLEESNAFDTFAGFDMYECGEDISLTKTFPNRLCEFKPEYLTQEDCLLIQKNFENLYLFDNKYGEVPKKIYSYIDNMVQMRIALELYKDTIN